MPSLEKRSTSWYCMFFAVRWRCWLRLGRGDTSRCRYAGWPHLRGVAFADLPGVLAQRQISRVVGSAFDRQVPAAKIYLQMLGTKHKDRGIPKEANARFRDVLLDALEQFHGADWSEDLGSRWREAINSSVNKMFEGYEKCMRKGRRVGMHFFAVRRRCWLRLGAEIRHDAVTQAGRHLRGVAFADLPGVLAQRQISRVVGSAFDRQVPAAKIYLQMLGTKHKDRGIPKEANARFRDVLLDALEQFHGADWSEDLGSRWREAINSSVNKMFEGYEKCFHV